MNSINYLNILLSGYFKNPELLELYLIRIQKISERDSFVSKTEFYDNCIKEGEKLKKRIQKLYFEAKNDLYQVLSYKKEKGGDISNTQKEIDNLKLSSFGIPLFTITDGKFRGHLYYSDIEFIERKIKIVLDGNQKSLDSTNTQKEIKVYKKTIWFKIGVMFANGEMDKLLQEFDGNGTQVAKNLGNKNYRPFITESIGVKKKTSDKSIFADESKMKKIISHCEKNNIPIVQSFLDNILKNLN